MKRTNQVARVVIALTARVGLAFRVFEAQCAEPVPKIGFLAMDLRGSVTASRQAKASGYVYRQTTDDELNGNAGNRGRLFAMGPYIGYQEGYWGITFKWQNESWVENCTKVNRYFLQFALRLN